MDVTGLDRTVHMKFTWVAIHSPSLELLDKPVIVCVPSVVGLGEGLGAHFYRLRVRKFQNQTVYSTWKQSINILATFAKSHMNYYIKCLRFFQVSSCCYAWGATFQYGKEFVSVLFLAHVDPRNHVISHHCNRFCGCVTYVTKTQFLAITIKTDCLPSNVFNLIASLCLCFFRFRSTLLLFLSPQCGRLRWRLTVWHRWSR